MEQYLRHYTKEPLLGAFFIFIQKKGIKINNMQMSYPSQTSVLYWLVLRTILKCLLLLGMLLFVSIETLLKWTFIINLIALGSGFILSKLGYIKAGRILSYISLVAVSLAIIYMFFLFVIHNN